MKIPVASVGLWVSGSHEGFMIIAILGLISLREWCLGEACDMRRR